MLQKSVQVKSKILATPTIHYTAVYTSEGLHLTSSQILQYTVLFMTIAHLTTVTFSCIQAMKLKSWNATTMVGDQYILEPAQVDGSAAY